MNKENKMKRFNLVIVIFLNVNRLFSQTDTILYKDATILYKSGKYKEASILYQKVIDINPNYKKAYDKIGACLINQKKTKSAIVYYEKYLKKDSLDSRVFVSLGSIYFNDFKSKKEIALNYFNKALKIDSSYAVALYYLGCYYSEKKDQKLLAEKYFFKSLRYSECEQFKACIFMELGSIYYDRKLYKEALEFLTKSIELDEKQPYAYITRYLCYSQLDELEKANIDYAIYKKMKKTHKSIVIYNCE